MSNDNENDTSSELEENDTIEDKRRKNVLENQKFLRTLHLFNVRDDLKSTVTSMTTHERKKIIDPSEIRRSSRIRSMPQTNYNNNNQSIDDKEENIVILTDDSSDEEDEDKLISAFISKADQDWEPVHPEKHVANKLPHPHRKATKTSSGGVKIYHPNTGLQASTVMSTERPHRVCVSKKINVAISSSEED
ncbi:hypothetical protein I4U23_029485 [Adineta vaga]|nr:hypothetical protein I4U23_029485 [Adineta vaga]